MTKAPAPRTLGNRKRVWFHLVVGHRGKYDTIFVCQSLFSYYMCRLRLDRKDRERYAELTAIRGTGRRRKPIFTDTVPIPSRQFFFD